MKTHRNQTQPRSASAASSPLARATASACNCSGIPRRTECPSVWTTRGLRFELVVDPQRALDAFYHPFAYAA